MDINKPITREDHLRAKVRALQSVFAVLSVCGCLVGSKMVPIRLFHHTWVTPASAFCFAIVFFLQNTISELSSRAGDIGKLKALEAIHFGTFSQVVAAGLFLLVRFLPASDPSYQEAYNRILGTSWILFGASIVAYLVSNRVVWDLFNLFRPVFGLGVANAIAGQLGNLVDTFVFTFLAFGLGHKWLFASGGWSATFSLIATQFVIKFIITGLLSALFPIFFKKHDKTT